MTKKLEPLEPREKGRVKIFTCGPSIYRRPHIGNYRTFLYEDVLVRFLELSGYEVKRTINFTDVEDKTIEEARKKERDLYDITEEAATYFYRETEELRIKLPSEIPSSSSSVPEAVKIIETLLQKGHAYRHGGDIFFDPLTFPGFGKLFGLDMSRWPRKHVRFRRDTYNGNRWNRGDFILWHGDRGDHNHSWDASIGKGRPSWNVQDPAMIIKHLGEQVDVNCGGIDNIYRHHDYNIAVMEAATGKEYAQIYLHGEHLMVDGRPMSKSRGNILFPDDIYRQGYSPAELRFFLTAVKHYREKLNYTAASMEASAKRLRHIQALIGKLMEPAAGEASPEISEKRTALIASLEPRFRKSLNHDLFLKKGIDRTEKILENIYNLSPSGLGHKEKTELKSQLDRIDSVARCLLD
jgi:cysteinyl-tRNA synthetase